MPTFKIDIAMDVRAYGYVEIEAENIDKAVELATPDFIKSNFESHGYGSDDFDYSSPRDIWLGDFECEETGETGFVEKDLPNSHYPGGLAHDAAPDMLAALKEAQRMVGAYVLALERGGNETDAAHARYVERQIAGAIAKAEGAA